MSLFKAIENHKEHRNHYREYLYRDGWCQSCVNHNSKYRQCPWCRDNRLHSNKVKELQVLTMLADYKNNLN